MTQEEFDKAPLLVQILYDETGMLVENHPDIAGAMEKYHQAKLKLLNIGVVSNQRELLIAYELSKSGNGTPFLPRHLAEKNVDVFLSNL